MPEKIELTEDELKALKDEEYFKGMVVTKLKSIEKTINGIPQKVARLEESSRLYQALILGIILAILGMAFKLFVR